MDLEIKKKKNKPHGKGKYRDTDITKQE
jgi:hypothetical protein